MSPTLIITAKILFALFLVILNGFFVAAEFALVKVRRARLEELTNQGKAFARTALWLYERMDASLSCCQLGITMASLALGWVGEPVFAELLRPAFQAVGVTSEAAVHALAFTIAFTTITGLHLIIGEQAPKIFAIRRPETMVLWCAIPLKFFYVISYPLLKALSACTSWLLRRMGVDDAGSHETPHSEAELRSLLEHARSHGELSSYEHELIHGVFEFDDLICRRVMVPRSDVVFFDVEQSLASCIEQSLQSRHSRYPVCEGSMDEVVGVLHIKDLLGTDTTGKTARDLMRPPRKVAETMPISSLLRHFQSTHQLMAIVVDEYGTVIGIVTLENVLEPIIGSVEDEFDTEQPEIIPEGKDHFLVLGSASLRHVADRLELSLDSSEADTFSGLLMQRLGRIPEAGDVVALGKAKAEVLEVRSSRAERVRVTLNQQPGKGNGAPLSDGRHGKS